MVAASGDVAWFHLTRSVFGDGAVALTLVLPWIRRAPGLFLGGAGGRAMAGLWTQVTKQLIDVPSSFPCVPGPGEFHLAGPAFIATVSFPSGHAAAAGPAGVKSAGAERACAIT